MQIYKKLSLILKLKIMLIIFIILWLIGLVQYVNYIPRTKNDDRTFTGGIAILTGGSLRLTTGINLLNQKLANRIFISGVGKDVSINQLLISSGKLPDNIADLKQYIDLDYEAKDTYENAREIAKWVKKHNYQSIRLVTANYHMPRSYYALKSVMPDVEIIQNPVFPKNITLDKWWNSGVTKKILFLEYNKYLASLVWSFT